MTEQTRTLLIIGAVAVGAYLVYKRATGPNQNRVASTTITSSSTGTGQSVTAATGQGASGDASFWNSLGSVGKGLNGAVSSVESTYNNIYDLFGGGSTSTNTGQGNNGTAG